ncbi:MAG: quinol:cytochrome C oxidoreductase [Planctomycetaceae bacterium]|nr:quinol:cytochrome C oxidoreductase [Planctomycetaceae bacterium]
MHAVKKTKVTSPNVSLGDASGSLVLLGGVGGLVLIGAAFAMSFFVANGVSSFLHVYLVNFLFFISISLGALFFVLIQHLTRAGWSVAVRRIAEVMAGTIPYLAILFIPILLSVVAPSIYGASEYLLYLWVNPKYSSEILAPDKAAYYLNPTLFGVRAAVYFAAWFMLSRYYLNRSRIQDENGDHTLTTRMQFWSAPSVLLFAITVIFASFDWSMSLAPIWFSTIWPVYFFAGGMLGAFCTIILILLMLQKRGILGDDVTEDHYHDLSKFTFGFIFFWSYIAFSQFILIWYANIPEETIWYQPRLNNGWRWASLLLLCGHTLVPFLLMMPRTLRRSKNYLWYAVIALLAMHWFDHFWIVMPQMFVSFNDLAELGTDLGTPKHIFGPVEACCFLGMALLYVAFFCWEAGDRPLIPLRDPRLTESLNHKVH